MAAAGVAHEDHHAHRALLAALGLGAAPLVRGARVSAASAAAAAAAAAPSSSAPSERGGHARQRRHVAGVASRLAEGAEALAQRAPAEGAGAARGRTPQRPPPPQLLLLLLPLLRPLLPLLLRARSRACALAHRRGRPRR